MQPAPKLFSPVDVSIIVVSYNTVVGCAAEHYRRRALPMTVDMQDARLLPCRYAVEISMLVPSDRR